MDMSTVSSLVASKLLSINAIKLNLEQPFTWASGIKSPIYCDNRIILSHPKVRNLIIDQLQSKLFAFGDIDVVAGVATAGIPHGALLADRLGKPFIYVRSSAKAHGRENKIEGEFQKGAKVLVIEDLISTGMSSLRACDALIDNGAVIRGVLAIFTYGFAQSKKAFSDRKIPMDTLTNYKSLLTEAVNSAYIAESDINSLASWAENPQKWSHDHKES